MSLLLFGRLCPCLQSLPNVQSSVLPPPEVERRIDWLLHEEALRERVGAAAAVAAALSEPTRVSAAMPSGVTDATFA